MADVLELALLLARKVTHRLAADPAVASANVAEAVRLVSNTSSVRVAVHPRDRQTVEESLPQLKLQLPKLGQVEIVEDDTLAPGGCRIFTAGGQIDADLDAQLNRIAADLVPDAEDPSECRSTPPT
jgi:flagellar assembly protein FliH